MFFAFSWILRQKEKGPVGWRASTFDIAGICFMVFEKWRMETPPDIEFKFFKSVENISFEEVQAKRMGRAMQWLTVQMSCFKIVCSQLNRQFSLLLKGQSIFIAVYNIPLNIQKRNEQSIKEGSWLFKYSLEHAEREWTFYEKKVRRAFFALFLQNIFSKFWISRHFYDLLGTCWWCYSTQKNAPVHF